MYEIQKKRENVGNLHVRGTVGYLKRDEAGVKVYQRGLTQLGQRQLIITFHHMYQHSRDLSPVNILVALEVEFDSSSNYIHRLRTSHYNKFIQNLEVNVGFLGNLGDYSL